MSLPSAAEEEVQPNGRRICLFGGTFDPIHLAHLEIASAAERAFSLERILFVTSANPPHKDDNGLTPYEDRFRMVELACAPHLKFEASRLEAGTERSYTINTLERVRSEGEAGDRILFLIGSDAFDEITTWKRWEDVLKLTEFIVVSRPGTQYEVPQGALIHRLDDLALSVSSSGVRSRLADGEPTPELPPEVRAYIEERGLYGAKQQKPTSVR